MIYRYRALRIWKYQILRYAYLLSTIETAACAASINIKILVATIPFSHYCAVYFFPDFGHYYHRNIYL